MLFVVARTANRRPSLMHLAGADDWTACGVDMRGWSRYYTDEPIAAILCLKCAKKVN